MPKPTLTDKQRRFVNEYLVDLNATKAAERAGYSKKSARQQGAENLSKPVIQAAIQRAMDGYSKTDTVGGILSGGGSVCGKIDSCLRRTDIFVYPRAGVWVSLAFCVVMVFAPDGSGLLS